MKESILFTLVSVFIDKCDIDLLHCYDCRNIDDEERYRCDYNRESSFEILRKYDEDVDEYSYMFFDLHDTDGPIYTKCDIDRAIDIVKEEAKKQGVIL